MDIETGKLLNEIRSFLKESQMGPAYFGQQAAGNCELVKRLEAGRTVTLPTAERIRTYIASKKRKKNRR